MAGRARIRVNSLRNVGGFKLATIEFDKVSKVFDDGTKAVFDLDLAIADGELMVMVGPSGCGKTTALRMVAGLEEITDGELRIDDQVVNDFTPKERDIAMVFQNYALYPHMTVEQNLAFGLKLRKLPKEEISKRVNDAATALEIRSFSSGNRVRFPVASASGLRWAARSCVSRTPFSWTSLFRISTQSCVCRCAPRSTSFSAGWE